MPTYVDSDVRADIIAGGLTETMSRMNASRIYEGFMGAANRDLHIRLVKEMKSRRGDNFLYNLKPEDVQFVAGHLRDYYSMINPKMVEFIDGLSPDELDEHVEEVLEEGVYVYFPTDNVYNIVDVIDCISRSPYNPHKAPVKHTMAGKEFVTERPFRINRNYIMLLDRTGRDFLSVSSSKVNAYLIPIKGGASSKHTHQHSQTPTTAISETENRIMASYSRMLLAEQYDITLNPNSHRAVVREILEGENLHNPNFSIDREITPYGNTMPVKMLKHIYRASGVEMVYIDDDLIVNKGEEKEDE